MACCLFALLRVVYIVSMNRSIMSVKYRFDLAMDSLVCSEA